MMEGRLIEMVDMILRSFYVYETILNPLNFANATSTETKAV